MPKPSEIFDTPEAVSRVVGNEEIIEKLWRKFKSVLGHSSIDAKNNSMYDLENFVRQVIATKDQEKEEAVKEAYEAGRKSFLKDIHKIDRSLRGRKISYIIFDEVGTVDWDKLAEALPTEDNN